MKEEPEEKTALLPHKLYLEQQDEYENNLSKANDDDEEEESSSMPPQHHFWAMGCCCILIGFVLAVIVSIVRAFSQTDPDVPHISVAFIGNSMLYYNDMPRLLHRLTHNRMHQDSCLHGDASLESILETGNGMYGKFNTTHARIRGDIYDFGQCTVPQLLFGKDPALDDMVMMMQQQQQSSSSMDMDMDMKQDDGTDTTSATTTTNISRNAYLRDDGTNPCLENPRYLTYLNQKNAQVPPPPKWDYIVMNDNTRNPGRSNTRAAGVDVLLRTYLPWLHQTGASLVFLDTHAYFTPARDLTGLGDIPLFTYLTYEGYRQYVSVLSPHLPEKQRPRIAPAGIAYLTIWEEDRALWEKLFHSDSVHASPLGSFLEACVIHCTIYDRMPSREVAIHEDMTILWEKARVMQEWGQPPNPFPTREEAEYLYDVADRVAHQGYRPDSFKSFIDGEVAPDV